MGNKKARYGCIAGFKFDGGSTWNRTRDTGIFNYGKEGSLRFYVSTADVSNSNFDDQITDDYLQARKVGDSRITWVKYFPITEQQLNYILAEKSLTIHAFHADENDSKTEYVLCPSDNYSFDITNLRISKQDADEFENTKFIKIQDNNSPTSNNITLSVEDLFTSPPSKEYEIFTNIRAAASSYIDNYGKLPTSMELWAYMKQIFQYDTQNKAFINVSYKKTDIENFRKCFKRWTK